MMLIFTNTPNTMTRQCHAAAAYLALTLIDPISIIAALPFHSTTTASLNLVAPLSESTNATNPFTLTLPIGLKYEAIKPPEPT